MRVISEPDVAGFQIPVDDAFGVGEFQAAADLTGDSEGVFQGEAPVFGVFDQTLDIATAHEGTNHVWLAVLFAEIEDRHDVGIVA